MICAKRARRVMDFSKKTSEQNTVSAKKIEQPQRAKSPHKVELDHLHSMSVTGVMDVPTFTDKSVIVRLSGETLSVTGQNLAVKSLDIESGTLLLDGQVNCIKYTQSSAPTSFVKKLLK